MQEDVLRPVPARRGHFLLESGHQGDRWLDLELLCLRPEPDLNGPFGIKWSCASATGQR